jgi:hypothetical protein
LRTPGIGFNFKFTEQSVADNVEVQLAHASDDGLAGFLVRSHHKGGILFGQALEPS